MTDPTPPIEQNIAPGDEQFDPAQLDDAGLQAFLGLREPAADAPDVDAAPADAAKATSAQDAAADKALDSALAPEGVAPEPVAAEPAKDEQAGGEVEGVKPADKVEKKPLYVAYGKDGKPLEDVPVAEVEITVGGKTKRVDLDKLARMASSGGYNEQLQEEVKSAREAVVKAQQLEAHARALAAEQEAILRDPDHYLKRVEEYAQAQSPEARAERAERQLQAVTQQQSIAQAEAYVHQQAESAMLPKIQQIIDANPHVKEEEIIAHFTTLIRPFRGAHGGMVAPQFIPTVLDVIDSAIAPWAAQMNEAREETKKATEATTAATTAATLAQEAQKVASAKAVKAKAEISRTIAPVGRAAVKAAAPKAPVKTANEGAERALEDALNSVFTSS